MGPKRTKNDGGRNVVRKGDQLVATLLDERERRDFEKRLKEKCREVGLPLPTLIPQGKGEQVAVLCNSRDHAIFVQDLAEEALDEMGEAK